MAEPEADHGAADVHQEPLVAEFEVGDGAAEARHEPAAAELEPSEGVLEIQEEPNQLEVSLGSRPSAAAAIPELPQQPVSC